MKLTGQRANIHDFCVAVPHRPVMELFYRTIRSHRINGIWAQLPTYTDAYDIAAVRSDLAAENTLRCTIARPAASSSQKGM